MSYVRRTYERANERRIYDVRTYVRHSTYIRRSTYVDEFDVRTNLRRRTNVRTYDVRTCDNMRTYDLRQRSTTYVPRTTNDVRIRAFDVRTMT